MPEGKTARVVFPLNDRVLVLLDKAPDKIGRILIPDASKEKPSSGELIAVGAGCEESLREVIGCKVHFHHYSGSETPGQENIVYIREFDLLGYEAK